ncbi:MAG: ATP-binding protein [Bacteroidia bacterium]|nr:ATP-binding protein [Bacteroidia bacterium]
MQINFKNKLHEDLQVLNLVKPVTTFIGGNGCGKSSILEAIFEDFLNDSDKRVICFSSGQNELFTNIFWNHKTSHRRFIKSENEIIRSFYFDYSWVRLLIFFASQLKSNGMVRKYLLEHNYTQERRITADRADDLGSHLWMKFRIPKWYVDRIKGEIEEEGKEEFDDSKKRFRKTYFHEILENFTGKFFPYFDFQTGYNVVKSWINIDNSNIFQLFSPASPERIFSFFALGSFGYGHNFPLEEIQLNFENGMELRQLSDGEYQLLSIYAILDLFDNRDTLFLFDEIDSHLYYRNIENLWNRLSSVQGKVLTTTHISESIIRNEFEALKYIEGGIIKDDLTAKELLRRFSRVVGISQFEYKVAGTIKNIVLLDDEDDWQIFTLLLKRKLGTPNIEGLSSIVPIKVSSSFGSTSEKLGKGKYEFIKGIKSSHLKGSLRTRNIFLICDRDNFPVESVNEDMTVQPDHEFKELRCFQNEQVESHLLCWKRREIENYLISVTALDTLGLSAELARSFPRSQFQAGDNLDGESSIQQFDAKSLIHQIYKQPQFNIDLLQEYINSIPPNEISDDILKVYDFLMAKIKL